MYVSGGFQSKEFYCLEEATGRLVWGLDLDELERFLRGLGPVTERAPAGFAALRELLRERFPPLLSRLDPYMAHANSILEGVDAYRREIAAFFGNVTAAIRSIAQRMRPEDTFVMFYSGHGGQVRRGDGPARGEDGLPPGPWQGHLGVLPGGHWLGVKTWILAPRQSASLGAPHVIAFRHLRA